MDLHQVNLVVPGPSFLHIHCSSGICVEQPISNSQSTIKRGDVVSIEERGGFKYVEVFQDSAND